MIAFSSVDSGAVRAQERHGPGRARWRRWRPGARRRAHRGRRRSARTARTTAVVVGDALMRSPPRRRSRGAPRPPRARRDIECSRRRARGRGPGARSVASARKSAASSSVVASAAVSGTSRRGCGARRCAVLAGTTTGCPRGARQRRGGAPRPRADHQQQNEVGPPRQRCGGGADAERARSGRVHGADEPPHGRGARRRSTASAATRERV